MDHHHIASDQRWAAALDGARERFGDQPLLLGEVRVRPTGRGRFPAFTADHGDTQVALLGRYSWFSIFLGRGQPIGLADGTRWRLRATGCGRLICPVIVDVSRGKVAIAGSGRGAYGVNGRAYGYELVPADSRRGRSRAWTLREHEVEVASLALKPRRAVAWQPIPLAAVLLSFALIQFGVPGEKEVQLPWMWH